MITVKPVIKTIWKIGTPCKLRTATSVPRFIHYVEMDLRNKATSEFRTVFDSPLGAPFPMLHYSFYNAARPVVVWVNFRLPFLAIFQAVLGFNLYQFTPLAFGPYVFPLWSQVIGFLIALTPVALVIITAIYRYCRSFRLLEYKRLSPCRVSDQSS